MSPSLCDKCGVAVTATNNWPFCPHGRSNWTARADDIPGGMVLENMGPEPVTVYSHSERRRLLHERGLQEFVRHVPLRGSDKSPHTTRWI